MVLAPEHTLIHSIVTDEQRSKVQSYIEETIEGFDGHFISVSDWITLLPDSISHLFPGGLTTLGTDGYGLSETREALRDHFGISAKSIINKAKEILG